MRLFRSLVVTLTSTVLATYVCAQTVDTTAIPKEKHAYQSDVARLRKIVINSLYSHREIFLRELISNANDALEKLRLTSLTDKSVWDGADPLNITIKAVKNEDGPGGRIIISDTGIGMSPEELTTNLGTLAKSGTSDFLAQAENQDIAGAGHLIGAFGLGFYSSFLVADQVSVSSIPPKSERNPNPTQYVFSSSADDPSFEIYQDPRGNILGRGTEITLVLKDDASEYLDEQILSQLVYKHSSFSSAFPIYLYSQKTEEVPDDEDIPVPVPETEDDDEILVEDADMDSDKAVPPKMKSVVVEEWMHLNAQPPLWMRDPKNVSDEEYSLNYQATFKDFTRPLAWLHFSGESSAGVPFRAIIYVPSHLDNAFWQQPTTATSKDIRLMVKRVFITSDLDEDGMPKWVSWVKAIFDTDDLPLNVSRETLQSNRFLKEMKQIIIRRLIQLFTRIAQDDPEKFAQIQKVYGSAIKLGAVDDVKNREKLAGLTRYGTNQRNSTSLDEYLENKKRGQKQIFYLGELGKSREELSKSVFLEKLDARGYEVLLLNEPLDEILIQNIRTWKNTLFQDVAKAGLTFGDEDLEEEREEQNLLTEKFRPLLDWLKIEAKDVVRDVVISNRLVTSPCAVVADAHGYTANVQKLMSASNKKADNDFMLEYAKKQKFLEINPRSPLIQGLLKRVNQLPSEEEGRDLEAEDDLREVASILIDGALVRSGFDVPDSNGFFARVDRVLRRSLGVSETAPTDTTVKPAPPVDPELPEEDFAQEDDKPRIEIPEHLKDQISFTMEEIDEEGNLVHDEL